jgi:hypothetical protein
MEYGFMIGGQMKGTLFRDPVTGKVFSLQKQHELTNSLNESTELRVQKVNRCFTIGFMWV